MGSVLRSLRKLISTPLAEGVPDRQLLESFAQNLVLSTGHAKTRGLV
jgi:hypothetical protein